VLASNHLHLLDPPLIGASCKRRVHPMAKRELFEAPLVGWVLWPYGAFPVRRFSADIGALRAARGYLRNGDVVLMFPEGTRSKDAQLHPALPGAAMVALLADVPVVPVAITGTEGIRIPGVLFRWVRRNRLRIRVVFGEPFQLPQSSAEARHAEEATDLMMRRVAALLPEAYRGAYGAASEGEVVFARQPRDVS
jgi:1-acyl-sn-glycerol-3-phosphate acyltransferase